MKLLRLMAIGACALALLPSPAHAQEPTGLVLEASSAGIVPYAGAGAFGFTVTVGCLSFLENPTADGVVVDVLDPQSWLSAEPAEVDVGLADCGPGGTATATGSLPFTVAPDAPAVTGHVVRLQASLGTATSNEASATYAVEYVSNYTIVTSIQFPYNVTEPVTTFTVTGTQASNAPSMIMVDDFSANNGALVSGFGALQYTNTAGAPESKEYTIKFTAPTGDWETATATLQVYGHYNFDGMAGEPMDRRTLTWEFVNGGVETQGGDEGGEESPAPVFVFVAIGLLAFAAVRRRQA